VKDASAAVELDETKCVEDARAHRRMIKDFISTSSNGRPERAGPRRRKLQLGNSNSTVRKVEFYHLPCSVLTALTE
jgi:hypothetical protein